MLWREKKEWKCAAFWFCNKVLVLSSLGIWSSPDRNEILRTFKYVFLTFVKYFFYPYLGNVAQPCSEKITSALYAWPGQGHSCQFRVLQTIYTCGHWTLTCKLRSHRSVEKQSAFTENTLPWQKGEPENCKIKGLKLLQKAPVAPQFDRYCYEMIVNYQIILLLLGCAVLKHLLF